MVDAEDLPTIGETIGGYQLKRLIATGGMGAVFAAEHKKLGRRAAVKVLDQNLASDREYVSRFLHEARIVNDVRHPNIVDIYDFIEEADRVACVMELIDGPTLARAVGKHGAFNAIQALNATRQILDALTEVHAAGVVHRDLKPQNVLVVAPLHEEFWEVPAVKILDFGIAKQTSHSVQHKTTTGSIMGTPAYMAPEQVAAAPVSGATDLYAVAEMLYEMIAGRRLFQGENLQILQQKLNDDPPMPELDKNVKGGAEILALVRAATVPDPEQRPAVDDFKKAVEELVEVVSEIGTDDIDFDGGATVLNLQAPTFDDDTDKFDDGKISTLGGGMNTMMFFNRIVEDIEEVNRPETPEPRVEPEALPPLELAADTPLDHDSISGPYPSGPYASGPSAPARATPSNPSQRVRPASPAWTPAQQRPPVIRGTPEAAPQMVVPDPVKSGSRFLWLLFVPVIAAIALLALPGVRDRAISTAQKMLGMTPNPVRAQLAAFKERHPDVTGSTEDHVAAALEAHVLEHVRGLCDRAE